jgi:hypothetical protein
MLAKDRPEAEVRGLENLLGGLRVREIEVGEVAVGDFVRRAEFDGVLPRDAAVAVEGDDVERDGDPVAHDLVVLSILHEVDGDDVVGSDAHGEARVLEGWLSVTKDRGRGGSATHRRIAAQVGEGELAEDLQLLGQRVDLPRAAVVAEVERI